jgi:hypothetical protein
MEEEVGASLAALSFFASRSMAEKMAAEFSGADVTVERLAEVFRRVFPDAAMEYAEMGRVIYEAIFGGGGRNARLPARVGSVGS